MNCNFVVHQFGVYLVLGTLQSSHIYFVEYLGHRTRASPWSSTVTLLLPVEYFSTLCGSVSLMQSVVASVQAVNRLFMLLGC